MYQEERLQLILEYLKEYKKISIEKMCTLYNVSRDTARRDLVKLEQQGTISRTHGGAILPTLQREIKNYKDRLASDSREKQAIGKLAASLIKEKDKIILDASTTVQACSEWIQVNNFTVITNSTIHTEILANRKEVNIHLLGGQLNKEQRFLYGPSVISMLSNYYVDKTLIGAVGITEKGLTVADEEDGHVMKKMIEQAEQVIVLADHTKFEKNGFFKFAELSQINIIVTDKMPNEILMKIFKEHEIEVLVTEEVSER